MSQQYQFWVLLSIYHLFVPISISKLHTYRYLFTLLPNIMFTAAAAAAKSLQSCSTLCDPIDGSAPGSPVPGILQARTLEWVAISFCNAWKWKGKVKSLSCVQLLATPWTAAYQAPLSMGFSRQEYWSEMPLASPVVYKYKYMAVNKEMMYWLEVEEVNSLM